MHVFKKIIKMTLFGALALFLVACSNSENVPKVNGDFVETPKVDAPERDLTAEYTFDDFSGYWATLDEKGATEVGNYVEIIQPEWEFFLFPNGYFWLSRMDDYTIDKDVITLELFEQPSITSEGGPFEAQFQLVIDKENPEAPKRLYDLTNQLMMTEITQAEWDATNIMTTKDLNEKFKTTYE